MARQEWSLTVIRIGLVESNMKDGRLLMEQDLIKNSVKRVRRKANKVR